MEEQQRVAGYKRKPLWVYGAAVFLLVVPFANFLISIARQGEGQWYSPSVWATYAQAIPLVTWGFVLLTILSGALLLLVRQVTWILALATLFILVAYNLLVFKQFTVLAVLLLGMILLTPFKRPYLNPKTRWWEQYPRYQANIFAKLSSSGTKIRVHNISLSGMLVEWIEGSVPGTEEKFLNISLDGVPEINCEIVRRHENLLGVRFDHLSRESKKAIKAKIKEITDQEENKVR